ncbi:MAG: alpha/beta hydrolase [Hyphomonadaceae bacterium]|nr:alpha/beta hydrolase [Hyphomonadaceae bacterium]
MNQDELVAGYERLGGPEAGQAARALYGNPTSDDYAAFFRHCLPLYSRKGDLSSLAASGARAAMNPVATQRFFAPSGEAWRFDHRNRLSRVECPVLVILGEHDPVTPAVWGREVAEALPAGKAELIVFPEASHLVTVDEPEAFAAVVSRFIAAR